MTRVAWVPWRDQQQIDRALGPVPADVHVLPFPEPENLPGDPSEVNFLVTPYMTGRRALAQLDHMTSLEVVQVQSAGTDDVIAMIPDQVALYNAAGLHDTATAELAISLALAQGRGLDRYARDQRAGIWQGQFGTGLADKRVLILGAGHIGQAIERRLAGFEVASITRVARTPRTDPMVHGLDELPSLLEQTDVVFIIIPLNDQSRGLFDDALLSRLPDGALVVNVGRGPIIDTDALLAHTASGRLRAALDVTDPEPLPADHPLRQVESVLISPHVGGWSDAFEPRRDRLISAQLRAWITGDPMANLVKPAQP